MFGCVCFGPWSVSAGACGHGAVVGGALHYFIKHTGFNWTDFQETIFL